MQTKTLTLTTKLLAIGIFSLSMSTGLLADSVYGQDRVASGKKAETPRAGMSVIGMFHLENNRARECAERGINPEHSSRCRDVHPQTGGHPGDVDAYEKPGGEKSWRYTKGAFSTTFDIGG